MADQTIIAGNWKMNLTYQEAEELLNGVLNEVSLDADKQIVIFGVPFPYLDLALNHIQEREGIFVAAQNLYFEENGAFTGEVSASMLASMGVQYVILGHSERRAYFNETNEVVSKKVRQALIHKIRPILCIGETLDVRESGNHESFVLNQLDESLKGLTIDQLDDIVIAYEPVWAIGTGKTASPEQAESMHAAIHEHLNTKYAKSLPILYGGSMKPANAEGLLSQKHINGGLIGGASLKVDSFSELIKMS